MNMGKAAVEAWGSSSASLASKPQHLGEGSPRLLGQEGHSKGAEHSEHEGPVHATSSTAKSTADLLPQPSPCLRGSPKSSPRRSSNSRDVHLQGPKSTTEKETSQAQALLPELPSGYSCHCSHPRSYPSLGQEDGLASLEQRGNASTAAKVGIVGGSFRRLSLVFSFHIINYQALEAAVLST